MKMLNEQLDEWEKAFVKEQEYLLSLQMEHNKLIGEVQGLRTKEGELAVSNFKLKDQQGKIQSLTRQNQQLQEAIRQLQEKEEQNIFEKDKMGKECLY